MISVPNMFVCGRCRRGAVVVAVEVAVPCSLTVAAVAAAVSLWLCVAVAAAVAVAVAVSVTCGCFCQQLLPAVWWQANSCYVRSRHSQQDVFCSFQSWNGARY
jgi:hypothetical protein